MLTELAAMKGTKLTCSGLKPALAEAAPPRTIMAISRIGSVTVEGIFPVGKVLPATGTSPPGETNGSSNAEGNHGD